MRRRWTIYLLAVVIIIGAAAAVYWFTIGRQQVNLVGSGGGSQAIIPDLPPGFTATLFASDLSNPRFMNFGPDGQLYVADRGNGRIVILPDENKDGIADSVQVFATDLKSPHSLVFHEEAWYVGVPFGVIKLTDDNGDGVADTRTTMIDDLPTGGGHSTRTVLFLPDGRLAVSIGSSCNVCTEEDARRATVVAYDQPASGRETIFATGLRNAVGLALHPESGELWATNNGRDMMGDDLPPETVYIVREGEDYGWPSCHNGNIVDPDMGSPDACTGVTAPVVEMQAHSAPLGLAFYTGSSFPTDYHGDLFVAFHGSWNRRIPTGYKIVRIPIEGSMPAGPAEDFATGWLDLDENVAFGRPVGLAVGPDGALYVSDDKAGLVYRIAYTGS